MMSLSCLSTPQCLATPWQSDFPLESGFIDIPVVSPNNFKDFRNEYSNKLMSSFCSELDKQFKRFKWDPEPCEGVDWKYELTSHNKWPLVYAKFGSGTKTTLILSGVHPDELTPMPIAFKFAKYLAKNPGVYADNEHQVIIAPLVNPDGFLKLYPSRTNNNVVDLNRNFFTADWYENALRLWKSSKNKAMRYHPGFLPNSEIETLFQIKLIDDFMPDKILSMHAPLGFLDYDGPGDRKPKSLSEFEKQAKQLVQVISKQINNYRVVDYSFYPGSLGNYAGQERNIPTITVELETTDPIQYLTLWERFLPGIKKSIAYPFESRFSVSDTQEQIPFSLFYN